MYVAVDDTDSMHGNCTTFLATEIIRELDDLDLIGNPRLVRLNPATPWKTRGNGSLVMRFGHGSGPRRFIGRIGNRDVFCYDRCTPYEPDPVSIRDRIVPLIERYHEDEADPGLLISAVKPSQEFYWRGVRTIISREIVDPEIERIGATTFEIGCGRGLIGCTCGMAWRPRDSTFELLAYRPSDRWGRPRIFDPESIRSVDMRYPSTFNSWEERFHKVAMVPATPCPVMYGLRGDSERDLIEASSELVTEPLDRWMVFLTNQGTDDHIIHHPRELVPNQSYQLSGTVASNPRHIMGGHVLIDIDTRFGTVTCAAYEPSKEFRHVLDWLDPGDEVEVVGELRDSPRTLNLEKVHVLSTIQEYVKVSNPVCPICSRTMKSTGKGQKYKCKKCGTRSYDPITRPILRQIVPGWYEPPTAARRHLSKPLKRMGLEQPVEFVNGRT
ncbi:MAG: tRNA(Ile)(2)-agmatinylcytidine synthase [Thermoplasmata archaeon]|nr:tRNA(Ile)(2)-agmatinylcytidine synthase [Thermoplasmata archaeon]